MSKATNEVIAALKALFETGDIPDGTDFDGFIQLIQDAVQEHEHKSSGGGASGTGDAGQIAYPDDISGLFLDGVLSPMVLTGAVVSEGTDAGTIKVTALTALLRATTDEDGVLTPVSKALEDNITLAAADTVYHIALKYNGGEPTVSTQTGQCNGTTEIGIGVCMKDASNNVFFRQAGLRLSNGLAKFHRRAAHLREIELCRGCGITHADTRGFVVAAGHIYHGINEVETTQRTSAVDKFTLVYYGDDPTAWQFTADQTAIPNDQYNDYGANPGLVNLANNEYGCFWVYMVMDSEDLYVVYGRDTYKLAEALLAQPPAEIPTIISAFGVLLGCVIVKKGGADFTAVQMVTDVFFTGTAAADHGALAGLADDDHTQYVLTAELINSSAGAEDAGKPIKLGAAGKVNKNMIPDCYVGHIDYWSDVDDEISLSSTPGDVNLPNVVVADIPGDVTLVQVIGLLKVRMMIDSSTAANAIAAACAIRVKKSDGDWGVDDVALIDIPDNAWATGASAREGGDAMAGDNDVKSEVDGNATYNLRFEDISVDGDNLLLKDVQVGLRVYFK